MPLLHRFQALCVVLIWGVDFAVAKIVLDHFPPFFLLLLRFGITSVLLIPFLRKPPLPLLWLVVIAFTFSILHAGMIFLSLKMGLQASVSVVAGQMRVPLALLLSIIFLHEIVRWRSILGIFLSITGTLILAGTPNVLANYWAFLVALTGALGWAIYNTQLKVAGNVDYFQFMAWISLLATPMLLGLTLTLESVPWGDMPDIPFSALLGLLYLVSFSTILSQSLWYKLLQQYEVNQIVPYTLLVPMFGVLAAVLLLDESLTWPIAVGGTLTLIGVGIVVLRRPKLAEPTKNEKKQSQSS